MPPRRPKPPDENDRLREGTLPPYPGDDTDPVEAPVGPVQEVLDLLECNGDSGRPKPTLQNVVRVLELDPRWKGRIRFNELSSSDELEHTPVAPKNVKRRSDTLDGEVGLWMAEHYRIQVKTGLVAEAISIVAARHTHHPVREYLTGLKWDGQERVRGVLTRYFGATDCELVQRLGEAFLVSCVARIMRPGCKVDTTLILVGNQGAKKSTGLRLLAVKPDWFADTHLDLATKDLFEALQGRWIYELAELDAFRGRDWSRIKSMLSSPRDTWRRPYGRHSVQVDRQVVFAGTTNEDAFLGDPTGSRRFWPVRVGTIDLRAIERDRDQLWAEALHRYRQGQRWWLEKDDEVLLAAASEEFRVVDPWEDAVAEYLNGKFRASVAELLKNAVKKPQESWTAFDQSRIVGILKRVGWVQRRPRVEPGTQQGRGRIWEAPP